MKPSGIFEHIIWIIGEHSYKNGGIKYEGYAAVIFKT